MTSPPLLSVLRQAFDPPCLFLLIFHQQYSINRSQLSTRSVLISVWHYGRFSRNAFLGELEIPLDCQDLNSPQMERMALMSKVERTWIYLPYCDDLHGKGVPVGFSYKQTSFVYICIHRQQNYVNTS